MKKRRMNPTRFFIVFIYCCVAGLIFEDFMHGGWLYLCGILAACITYPYIFQEVKDDAEG